MSNKSSRSPRKSNSQPISPRKRQKSQFSNPQSPQTPRSAQSPISPKTLPLISVIIPAYNSAATLTRCIDSVLAQTYSHLDIIIIDDGSTDASGELADQFAHQDSRIRVLRQANQGLSAARNAGLKIVRGEFITFVDSDDTIAPELISTLYSALLATESDLSICSFTEVYPDSEKPFITPESYRPFPESLRPQPPSVPALPENPHPKNHSSDSKIATSPTKSSPESPASDLPLYLFDPVTCLTNMLLENGFTMSAWGKLYARHLFENAEFPVGKLHEDVGTTYRLILQSSKIAFVPAPLYRYYQLPSSIIHQSFNPQKLDLITLTDKMCDDLSRHFHLPAQPGVSRSADYPSLALQNLAFAVAKRRLHAHFSILRQLSTSPKNRLSDLPKNQLSTSSKKQTHASLKNQLSASPKTSNSSPRSLQKSLKSYILQHKSAITENPLATLRDHLALRTLELGLPVFNFAWKIYSRRKTK